MQSRRPNGSFLIRTKTVIEPETGRMLPPVTGECKRISGGEFDRRPMVAALVRVE